jgi:hypothetical protein
MNSSTETLVRLSQLEAECAALRESVAAPQKPSAPSERDVRNTIERQESDITARIAQCVIHGIRVGDRPANPGPKGDIIAYSAALEKFSASMPSMNTFASHEPEQPVPAPPVPTAPGTRADLTDYSALCQENAAVHGVTPLRVSPDGAYVAAPASEVSEATGYTAQCLAKQPQRRASKAQPQKPAQEKTKARNWTEICEQARIETHE